MLSEWQIRKDMIEIGRKVYEKDLAAATDGNISIRASGDTLFITSSGSCLGELDAADLIYADFEGRVLSGRRKPSSELPMHIAVYRERPGIHAIIHAHPPITTALTVAGLSLAQCVIPEIVLAFGCIPTAEYATPSSEEGPEVIRSLIRRHDALVLDRHGSLTVGRTLTEAFQKLEKVEYCARVTHAARQVGNLVTLTPDQVQRLDEVRRKMGLGDGSSLCNLCGTCGKVKE